MWVIQVRRFAPAVERIALARNILIVVRYSMGTEQSTSMSNYAELVNYRDGASVRNLEHVNNSIDASQLFVLNSVAS